MIRFFRRKAKGAPPETGGISLRLLQGDWRCTCCGETHRGLMDLAAVAPDPWPEERTYEPNAALRLDGNFLSEDFCVLEGGHFMIRAVLEIPVHGIAQPWGFGCWTSLSRANFDKYLAGFDSGDYGDEVLWFGWLCNRLTGYSEEESEALEVHPRPDRQRPLLIVRSEDSPLGRAQRNGVTADAMLELFSAYGHGPTAH
jgi:hypothetical protein